MADELLCDRLHLARGNTLYVHLRERGHQRLLRPLVALEQLGREPTLAILRHPQLDLADACHQVPRVVAGAVAEPAFDPLAFGRAKSIGHLLLEDFLQHRTDDRFKKILIRGQKALDLGQSWPQLL
jgi:hypothetical protein